MNADCNSSKMLITTSFRKLIEQVLHADCISFESWLQHHLTPVHSFNTLATLLGSPPTVFEVPFCCKNDEYIPIISIYRKTTNDKNIIVSAQ
jgi:hypothetical protein